MSFIPPGEKIVETKKCRISGQEFFVTDKDLEFYDALSPVFAGKKCLISSPTLSPKERQMRRMAWRNYEQFYKNTCSLTGQEIISTYQAGVPYKVASLESWWSDSWNSYEYNKKIDFSRPFFDQFLELDQMTLHMPLSVSKSENCAFTNFSVNNRNCYLCSRLAESEHCYYSLLIVRCKNCIDCSDVSDSEYLYECIGVVRSYHCFYCTDCDNCQDCYFLKDCGGCKNCFGSCNLRNAQFVFNNKQLSEHEYKKNLEHAMKNFSNTGKIRDNFLHFCEKFPKKYITGLNNENSFGNYLFDSSDIFFGFECHASEKTRFVYGGYHVRDSIDVSFGYFHDKSMEVCGGSYTYGQLFCINCIGESRNILYCKECVSATCDSFGCISLKKGRHCILNTPYSQHEYEKLSTQLIDHMRATGEWGEFFPTTYSPYAYNESAAQTHFPLTKKQVLDRELFWYESEKKITETNFTPLPITEYITNIVGYEVAQKNIDILLSSSHQCTVSGKSFRIIPQELTFYTENFLPIPLKHPTVRSQERSGQVLPPMELYDRKCGECNAPFWTAYSLERPEKILCEECYQKLVY